MARNKVSIITIRLDEEEAEQLEIFKKMVRKKSASAAFKYIMKEYPRWSEILKEESKENREIARKYKELLEVNTRFMLAFQDMVKALNNK